MMPFAWYHPDVPNEYRCAPQKAVAMYEAELRERARLLLRLGYSQEETKQRLRGNVLWDFELHAKPAHLDRVSAIVASVYMARGAGQGGTPLL